MYTRKNISKDNSSKVIEDYVIFPISISTNYHAITIPREKINLIWKKNVHLVANFNLQSPWLFVFKVSFDSQKYCLSATYMPDSDENSEDSGVQNRQGTYSQGAYRLMGEMNTELIH